MKTRNSLLKAAVMGAFVCYSLFASAQNFVLNGDFENGFATCTRSGSWDNGPFYLGQTHVINGSTVNLVDDWTGLNYGSGAANHPINSGKIYDKTSTCGFGGFPSGVTAYSGNRSVQVRMSYNYGLYANWAKGNLSSTLGEGCYWVCLATNNTGDNVIDGIVEVLLESSVDGSQTMVLRYRISANSGWKKNKGYFKLAGSEAGKYDRVLIRVDQEYLVANATSTNYINNVYVDDVSIATCMTDPDMAVADAGFGYEVQMADVEGEQVPVFDLNANAAAELGIHRWDIYVADDQNTPASEWTHLAENSGTVLEEGTFNSGTLVPVTADKYYNIVHAYIDPCYGWSKVGKLVRVKMDGTAEEMGDVIVVSGAWAPSGDEFGVAGEGEMRKQTGAGVGTEPMMYTIYPNPPVNEITIVPAETNTNQPAQPAVCEVYDVRGVVVIKSTDITVNNSVDISALPTGVYYIKIFTGNKVEVQRFLKK